MQTKKIILRDVITTETAACVADYGKGLPEIVQAKGKFYRRSDQSRFERLPGFETAQEVRIYFPVEIEHAHIPQPDGINTSRVQEGGA